MLGACAGQHMHTHGVGATAASCCSPLEHKQQASGPIALDNTVTYCMCFKTKSKHTSGGAPTPAALLCRSAVARLGAAYLSPCGAQNLPCIPYGLLCKWSKQHAHSKVHSRLAPARGVFEVTEFSRSAHANHTRLCCVSNNNNLEGLWPCMSHAVWGLLPVSSLVLQQQAGSPLSSTPHSTDRTAARHKHISFTFTTLSA
jgi:hypothetical protein